jgi:16S rRNA (adenine1518-N6/adenine1519-N6)-dimethyltransferase
MRLSDIRAALDRLDLRPTKSLGQNFLHDRNLAQTIATALLPERVPFCVEIGPGLGSLTEPLLEHCDQLLLVEKDARLAAWLRDKFPADRVEIVVADAIKFDWRPLLTRGPFPLAGNLPYYATSPILRHWLGPVSPVQRAVFAVQDEFADRLAAAPGSPDYSALSVRLQRLWSVQRERRLPPKVFHPEPGVDSALVTLERRPPRSWPPVQAEFFDELVQRGFSQRRKQLRSLLQPDATLWSTWCATRQLPATARAENLTIADWIDLARTLDPAAAALRETEEELGISTALTRLGKISACGNTGQEFVEVFTAQHNGPFILPPSEIECTAFFSPDLVDRWIAERPSDFAPGFLEVWRFFRR